MAIGCPNADGLIRDNRVIDRTNKPSSVTTKKLLANNLMDPQNAIDLCRSALLSALIIGAPMLLVGMAAGLTIGLIQALTQIQDQTVSFVPKLLAMAAVMIACMPWLMMRLVEFTREVFTNAAMQ
jgi:flagellar biosynthesis protein FliQ